MRACARACEREITIFVTIHSSGCVFASHQLHSVSIYVAHIRALLRREMNKALFRVKFTGLCKDAGTSADQCSPFLHRS